MKQIDVQIMQQSYVLTCPDGQEERVMEAVRRVDDAMTRIRDTGKVRSRERVAVLAALNMAFDVLDRDAQQAHLASAQAEMQALQQEQAAMPAEVSEAAQAEQQRQQELAEQLVLKLDQALENDARLL
ncbi:cell division protein ZapA [Comamonas testosteroni]|uniref:Cell division protein ZapA n=1 Tax=Comamonas testosteroni TaxID=285 RepID=A0A373FHR7_COMTE|nr:cell division protein ZapA [Comamonas testosteroni]RGE43700.1 cell division protein ZapA [Comamonas testosteroni]